MILGANEYWFKDVRSFIERKNDIESTPKVLLPFGEKHKMQGLAYVWFQNRIVFTHEGNRGSIADLTGDVDVVLNNIVSGTNQRLGILESEIASLTAEQSTALSWAKCIYKKGFPGLVIANYQFYGKQAVVKAHPIHLGFHDGTGHT